MTESESIKICNTIGFATSFSNPKGIPLNTTKEELAEAMKMAIQSLEKHIPKKPMFNGNNWYRCVNGCEIHKKQFEKDWYCPNCGQKLDWSDEE